MQNFRTALGISFSGAGIIIQRKVFRSSKLEELEVRRAIGSFSQLVTSHWLGCGSRF